MKLFKKKKAVVLNQGQFCTPEYHWRCVTAFCIITTVFVCVQLTSDWQRAGMLLNNVQAGTHHPHARVPVTQPQISTVLRLKAPDVKGEAEARPLRRGEGGKQMGPPSLGSGSKWNLLTTSLKIEPSSQLGHILVVSTHRVKSGKLDSELKLSGLIQRAFWEAAN